MSNSVAGELRTAISSIRNKSAEVSNSTFLEDIQGSRVESAKSQISFAQSGVQRSEMQVDDINSKLNPPPTKEVSSGKSGSKTVVDQEEVRKLESAKKSAEAQLSEAKSQVQEAEQEASIASQEALQQSGLTKELQSEVESLTAKADAIKGSLEKGEEVSEKDIKDLLQGINNTGNKIDDPNKAVKDSFLTPMEDKLQNILKVVESRPDLVVSDEVSGSTGDAESASEAKEQDDTQAIDVNIEANV